MEDAGLIKPDNSSEVLASMAGQHKGIRGVLSVKEKSKMKHELVNVLTSVQCLSGAGGAAFSALTAGAAISSGSIGATPSRAASSRAALGGGGGGGLGGGNSSSGQLSVAQFEDLKRELRTIVREELRAMKE